MDDVRKMNNFNNKLYQDLFNRYKEVFTQNIVNGIPNKSSSKIQVEVNEIWREKIKRGAKESVCMDAFKSEMIKLKTLLDKKKRGGIQHFFGDKPKSKAKTVDARANLEQDENKNKTDKEEETVDSSDIPSVTIDDEPEAGTTENKPADKEEEESSKEIPCPAQTKLKKEIEVKEKLLKNLIESRNLGILDEESATTISRRIKVVSEEKLKLERGLKRKKTLQKATIKFRRLEKEKKKKIQRDFPEIAASIKLKVLDQPGRPTLDIDQPEMMNDILHIATIGAACSDKRREDLFRSIKTLDDLHRELQKMGYRISR